MAAMKKLLLLFAVVAEIATIGILASLFLPEPPKTELNPVAKIPANAIVNTLGMPFVPVKGTGVAFCIWETRVKDYSAYAAANAGVDGSWKKPGRRAPSRPWVARRESDFPVTINPGPRKTGAS